MLLDKMMIQMHGLEVVRRMKDHAILKDTPIIIQSGDAYPDKIKASLDAGVDGYITKPFENNELLEIIHDVSIKFGIQTK